MLRDPVALAVTTTAARLVLADPSRERIHIRNLGGASVFIVTASGVAASSGMEIPAARSANITGKDAQRDLWILTAASTADVRVWEGGFDLVVEGAPGLVDLSVTTGKIGDAAVTPAKMSAPYAQETIDFFISGAQTTGTKKGGHLVGVAGTIVDVRARLDTAPVGSSFIVDVNKNGTTIFTTQGNRPTVADGGNNSSTTAPDVTSLAAGDRLTFDIDQIGSGTAGSDLYVSVTVKRTVIA